MPLYDYKCRKCKHIQEVRQSLEEFEADIIICEKCGNQMEPMISRVPFKTQGKGFDRQGWQT